MIINDNAILRILKENKNLILFCAVFFLASFIIGYFFAPENFTKKLLKPVLNRFENLFSEKSKFQISIGIFLNNLIPVTVIYITGFTVVIPLAILFINGFVLGYVASYSLGNVGLFVLLKSIIPHAIFEVPAFLISAAVSIRFGLSVLNKPKREISRKDSAIMRFREAAVIYLLLVLPLLLIAAFVEAYITYSLVF